MAYQQDAADALASIKDAGGEFEIFRPSQTFDNATGLPTDTPTASGKIAAIVLPKYKGPVFEDAMREALVRGKMKTLLAAAKGAPFKPAPLDVVKINGTHWQVIGCTELAPDGETPIIFNIGIVEAGTFTPTPEPTPPAP
jgi:hypothetical protein